MAVPLLLPLLVVVVRVFMLVLVLLLLLLPLLVLLLLLLVLLLRRKSECPCTCCRCRCPCRCPCCCWPAAGGRAAADAVPRAQVADGRQLGDVEAADREEGAAGGQASRSRRQGGRDEKLESSSQMGDSWVMSKLQAGWRVAVYLY